MKLYPYLLACLAAGTLVTSCSQEEEYLAGSGDPDATYRLQLNVSDGGYEGTDTRATYAGYTTSFADGDAIGVYAVQSDGTIVENINNRKYTYDRGVWELEGDVIEYSGTEFRRYTFYAYYPYQESPSFDPTASDPFANMVSRWTIGADQDENYTQYDLMTSSASAEGERLQGQVSFVMSHRMGLAIIQMPSLTYTFTNASMDDYVIPGIEPETLLIGGEEGGAHYDASTQTYMVLVKPETATAINGTYTGTQEMAFSIEANVAGGCATKFNINDESSIPFTLAVGDYFCADGKLVSGSSETVPDNAIGIVCYVGNPQPHVTNPDSNTETTDALYRDYPDCTHGIVLALDDSQGTTSQFCDDDGLFSSWFSSDADWAGLFVGCNTAGGTSPVDLFPGMQGYNNTELLTRCYERGSTTSCSYAYEYITAYRQAVDVPGTTTPWYLPSLAELEEVAGSMSTINRRISAVGGTQLASVSTDVTIGMYWSSNERNETYMWTHRMANGTGIDLRERGSRAGYFRLMLAF